MRWIAIFTNKPNSDDVRQVNLAAHLAYFEAQSKITLAGSTTPYDGEQSNGGVWVINGVSYQEAIEICEADPFFIAGLRQTMDVLAFGVAPKFEQLV